MRVSAIIVTKGRPEPLAAALESTARALPSDGEALVVDGDSARSAEPVVQDVRARHPQVDLRYVPSAPGMTLQRNVGIDAARGDVVVFLDDDVTFEPGLFEHLLAPYEDPGVVGVTGRIEMPLRPRLGNNPHSRLRWLILGGGRQGGMTSFGFRRPILDVDRPHDVEYMPGPLMSARREVAADVRFDERLTAYSLGEDDDFSFRVSRRGRVRYEPAAVIDHHELGFRQIDRRHVDRMQVVNRTYLFRKNQPQTLRARAGFMGLLLILCAHRVLNREWAGLRGLFEGMWEVRKGGSMPEAPARPTASAPAPSGEADPAVQR